MGGRPCLGGGRDLPPPALLAGSFYWSQGELLLPPMAHIGGTLRERVGGGETRGRSKV